MPYRCPQSDGTIMCSMQSDCSDAVPTQPPPPGPPPPPPSPPPSPDPSPSPPRMSDDGADGEWVVNVWYKMVGKPDCSAQPDASVTVTSSSCMCLIQEDGACFASATLKISQDQSVSAQVYAGDGCTGDALGGNTDVACGACTVKSIITGGVAIQIVCPFDAFGVCSSIGIPGGVDCYASCASLAAVVLFVVCCCCYSRRGKRDQIVATGYIQAPSLNGSE